MVFVTVLKSQYFYIEIVLKSHENEIQNILKSYNQKSFAAITIKSMEKLDILRYYNSTSMDGRWK